MIGRNGNWEEWELGGMGIGRNGNWEEWKLGGMEIGRNGNWEMEELRRKLGERAPIHIQLANAHNYHCFHTHILQNRN